jgi:hypothetical protein
MDPDQTLADLRDAIGGSDFTRAIELFEALDAWLSMNGAFPKEWHTINGSRLAKAVKQMSSDEE